jgi:hypothetical protein
MTMPQIQNVKSETQGIIHSFVTMGTGFADQALGVGFGLAEEVIVETKKVIGQAIDLVEAMVHSATRVARDANAKIGELLSDTMANGLATGKDVVHLFQVGGDHVSALAGHVLAPKPAPEAVPAPQAHA